MVTNVTRWTAMLAVVCFAVCSDKAVAQTKLRPGRLPRDVRAALETGLVTTITSGDAATAAAVADTRADRVAALRVPAGQSPTPFIAPGPFRATVSSHLKLKLKGDYRFYIQGSGKCELWLNEQLVLTRDETTGEAASELVSLIKGYNTLAIKYESAPSGDSFFRVYWSSDEFPKEPLPTDSLFYDSRQPALVHGKSRREGRSLLGRLSCLKCHAGDQSLTSADGQMPELAQQAPHLAGGGTRLNRSWVAHWILDPSGMRTNTTMPRLLDQFDETTARQHASDLAEYLATLKSPAVTPIEAAAAEAGMMHFEDLGCIGCHRFKEAEDEEDDYYYYYQRTTLGHVAIKFQPGQLGQFLREPHAHYPTSRMPNFHLSAKEAGELVGYLSERSASWKLPPFDLPEGDADRGAKLFAQLGCAQCHQTGPEATAPPTAPSLATLDPTKGCLAESPGQTAIAPRFTIDAEQRAALRVVLQDHSASLGRYIPAEAAARLITTLNCAACHRMDGEQSAAAALIFEEGEQGLPPEILPSLSWSGEKLRSEWTEAFIRGKPGIHVGANEAVAARPRHWLKARMPTFPAWAAPLAEGLAQMHGYGPDDGGGPKFDAAVVGVGAGLIEKNGGFNCLQCHSVAGRKRRF